MTTSAVSLDLTKAFVTVSHAILGSLSNDDGAATRTANKTIDLLRKTTTLHVQHTFLYISLPSLHDYDVKMPNFLFFSFFPFSTPEKFANIWRIKRVGIGAMKFETTRIHFLGDDSLPLPSSPLKLAVTKRAGSVWDNGSSPLIG